MDCLRLFLPRHLPLTKNKSPQTKKKPRRKRERGLGWCSACSDTLKDDFTLGGAAVINDGFIRAQVVHHGWNRAVIFCCIFVWLAVMQRDAADSFACVSPLIEPKFHYAPSVDLRQKLQVRRGLLAPTLALRPADNAPLWAQRQVFFTTRHRRPKPTTPAPPAPMPAKPHQTSLVGTRPPTQARHPRTPPSSPEARKTHYPKKLPLTSRYITFSVSG